MDSVEFTEWQAMYELEPFGDETADRRHGDATAVLANAHFGSKDKHYKASDFMLGDKGHVEEEEPEFIDDPVELSNLIRAACFGIAPKSTK